MSVIDKIKFQGTTYDVGKTPDTTLAVSGSPADAAKVGTELDKKVDKVTGKGLSTEDFTTAEKTKLAGIAEGATNIIIDTTLTQAGQAADAKETGDAIDSVKADLTLSNTALFGNVDDTFALAFEGGTYYSTTTGQALQKYYGGGYDLTRKVIKTTTFNAPCKVVITAKSGYAFSVFTSANGVITGKTELITSYTMMPGNQYGMTLRTTGGTDDISALDASQIIDVQYIDNIKQLDNVIEQSGLVFSESLNINSYPTENMAIGINNTWSPSGKSKFIPVSEFLRHYSINIKSHTQNGSIVCFLKSRNYTAYTTVDYATGTGRTFIPANETREFSIPDDCNYINILDYWDIDYLPQNVDVKKSQILEMIKNRIDGDQIGLTNNAWTLSACVLSTVYDSGTMNNKQGTISSASSSLMASDFIPVVGEMLELPLPWARDESYPNFGMSLYDENRQPIYGRAVTAYINRTENDPFVVWLNIYLPKEAKYFRTTYWSEDFQTQYSVPAFTYNLLMEIPDEYKPITHELPVDTYMQNAIRRARQLTDIKWTPKVNIPRYSMIGGGNKHFLDWFYADHEYTGIPYSGAGDDETHWSTIKEWGYTHNWVGQHIPISAFVTAARYPNSIMGEKADQSIVSYDSSPYGDVCTALVNYVVDGPTPLRGITNFFRTSGDAAFRTDEKSIANTDMNDICIGDFLYTNAHVIFISDLMRDTDGNVTHIEMSEETTVGNYNNAILGTKFGGVARRKMWDINDFKSAYGSYIRFRRVTFYGIPYIQSQYVDTGNEGDMNTFVDMACIPYLGEGAIYKVNYIHNSKVLIGATGFTSLVVTKDGEPFNTFDITGLTEISVGFSEIGSYEAYLSDGTTQTKSCHWTVVE